jgi:hypothetical protein
MKITRQFILDNCTDKHGWTQDQIEALGEKWPPVKGWIDRCIGSEISEENAERFKKKISKKLKMNNLLLDI